MSAGAKEHKLTEKQRKFIKEYLKSGNATQSAIKAGYSEKSAYSSGAEILNNPGVSRELERQRELMASKVDKYEITPEKVLREFAKVGFADMGQFASWGESGVKLRDSAELDEDLTSVVGEITETRTHFGEDGEKVTTRIKLADKLKALENLGKHLGLFKEQLSVVGHFQLSLPEDMEGPEAPEGSASVEVQEDEPLALEGPEAWEEEE